MWQHEITKSAPLLDGQGNLTQAGWAKKQLPIYDRNNVKGFPLRLKEWDYYLVANDRFALALTVADNGYMGLDSISFLDFEQRQHSTKSPMRLLPCGSTGLPSTSRNGTTATSGRGYGLMFFHAQHEELGPVRQLLFQMDQFKDGLPIEGNITLFDEPEESVVMCMPFDRPGHFYYNQKINCMRAKGTVTIGQETYTFDPADAFAVLDWGRGVWTYSNTWYWGSASGLVDDVPFGFNIGYGFGNGAAATENMLFYGGKAHKLSHVKFNIPGKPGREDYLSPWRFTSDDGRFEMEFHPILDRASCTDATVIKSDQHQVFGRFTGTVKLDDGTAIQVDNLLGFAEKVQNKW